MTDLELYQTKWHKVLCLRLDIIDYLNGDMGKKDFIKYALFDLWWLFKLVLKEMVRHRSQ